MLWIFFLFFKKKNSKQDLLPIVSHPTNLGKIQNATTISAKSLGSTNKKYYIIYVREKELFYKSDLFKEFQKIFKSHNCIAPPSYFRFFLDTNEVLKLQKSPYLTIYDVLKTKKNFSLKPNSKQPKSISDYIIQFIVQASDDFPFYFKRYGYVDKIYGEYYSLTLIQGNMTDSVFSNIVDSVERCLIDSDYVYWYDYSPPLIPLNRFSVGYVQTGTFDMKNYQNRIKSYNPLEDLSITGSGEIMTITDSGVAPRIPYFVDAMRPEYPYDAYDSSQRKIVYYSTFSYRGTTDKTDVSGHGTHVSCSAVGSSISGDDLLSLYNGAAPGAKAIVVDLEDGYGNMRIDSGLQANIDRMVKYGSSINTNSWGTKGASTTLNYMYNSVSLMHPELLFVFAAGNDGNYQCVNSPGSAKNVLTVGALDVLKTVELNSSSSINYDQIVFEVTVNSVMQETIGVKSLSFADSGDAEFLDFGFRSLIDEMNRNDRLDSIYETIVSKYDESVADFADMAVIVESCNELNGALAKNAKAIIIESTNDFLFAQSTVCSDKNLQKKAFGLLMSLTKSQLQSLPGSHITITPQIKTNSYLNYYPEVAEFSSRGPSFLGAIKPEIVAPGTRITSASNDANSPQKLLVASGSSMATPLVSGALATVRQYLIDKKGLKKDQIYSHLLKAIAIASADKPNPQVPDFDYGFGALNLANVIPEMHPNSDLNIDFLTNLKMISESTYTFTFEVTSKDKYDVRVAFSYIDESSQYSEFLNIKANLNVQTPDRTLLFPLGNEIEDSFSTSERIYIPKEELSLGIYTIIVSTSEAVFDNVINGSIVVSGAVKGLSQIEMSTSVQNAFDWSDYCIAGNIISPSSDSEISTPGSHNYHECKCDHYSSGLLCQFRSKSIEFDHPDSVRLAPFESCYFYATLDCNNYERISFHCDQYNQNNYLILRLNIGSSNKRISQYTYYAASNKSSINVAGPTNSDGSSVKYQKGTEFFFVFTNYGPTQVSLLISCKIEGKGEEKKNRNSSVSISISMYLVLFVIAIIFVMIIIFACKKKRRRNRQIGGATSSSVSSSSGSGNNRNQNINNNPLLNNSVNNNQQNFDAGFVPQPPPQLYDIPPMYSYGNQININPYYLNKSAGYDPNALPDPAEGGVDYYTAHKNENDEENSEMAPSYYPPADYNDKNKNEAEPINPYFPQFDPYKQNVYNY